MTDQQMLVQLLDKVGAILYDMGAVKARLDHGQKEFAAIHEEYAEVKATLTTVLTPLVTKVQQMESIVERAETTTTEFDAMKPEFANMRTVSSRFLAVALTSGAIVGAALWALGTIAPLAWNFIKGHISWS